MISLILIVLQCNEDPSATDNEDPAVFILYPLNESKFPKDSTIIIMAHASDNETIKEVSFYIDGALNFVDNTEPYQYEWATPGNAGIHTIQCSAKDENNNSSYSEEIIISIIESYLTDIDGNIYEIVKIGNQWWMAENLKVTRYQNGDSIPNITNSIIWPNVRTGAYSSYNNDTNNISTYGLLYNWYAVTDSRNLAPIGWHVPTDKEWQELEWHLGISQADSNETGWIGTDEGGKLKEVGTTHWFAPNTGATNSSGFTALPAGYRVYSNALFYGLGHCGYWWTSQPDTSAWLRYLYFNSAKVGRFYGYKYYGLSVRCVKD